MKKKKPPSTFFQGNPIDWMTKAMTQEQAPRPSGKGPKVNDGLQQFREYLHCFSGFGQEPPPDHISGASSKREVTFFRPLATHFLFETSMMNHLI